MSKIVTDLNFGKRVSIHTLRHSYANADPKGPIPIWLWPQGEFSAERWEEIDYAPGDSAQDLQVLRDFGQAF